ncbi:MAG: Txe/YoeB family addiction module toxin [Selenomonadaceae bacterium]|nr:Txe/YoeB family addiction module toxin [Selenomonadaceae bacterium]
MGKLQFTEDAWEDFSRWFDGDRKTLKKIMRLLEDIKRNGYQGIGKPEPLTGDLSGFWSRRIDDKNRIVYRMSDDIAEITQCGSHYRDK